MPAEPSSPPTEPAVPVLAVRAAEACRILNVGRRTLWSLTVSKQIPHLKIGRCVLYPIREIQDWLSSQVEGGAGDE